MVVKYCVICNKLFMPNVWNRTVCYDDHYHPCPVCGKDVLCNDPKRQTCTCSRECGGVIRKQTIKLNYGVDNVSQLPDVSAKISHSQKLLHPKQLDKYRECVICGKKFKLNHPYTQKTCSPKCRGIYRKESGIAKASAAKARATLKAKLDAGSTSPHVFKKICKYCGKAFTTLSNRQVYCGEDYGPCPVCGKPVKIKEMCAGPQSCSPECRIKKIQDTCMSKYGNSCVLASEYGQSLRARTDMVKYGVPHHAKTRAYHLKCAKTRYSSPASDGTILDSSYERDVYNYAKLLGLSVDRQLPFMYNHNGSHTLFIDFCIDGHLIECKGGHLIEGAYSDELVPIDVKLKLYHEFGAILVTDSIGAHALSNNSDPYIASLSCIDIKLFQQNQFCTRSCWDLILLATQTVPFVTTDYIQSLFDQP